MQRTFNAKVQPTTWGLVAVIAAAAIYFAWFKIVIPFIIALGVLVIIIERILNTKYTIDDEFITVSFGRFSKEWKVDISDIIKIEKIERFRIAGQGLTHTLIITASGNRMIAVNPQDEQAFTLYIKKKYENAKK